MPFNVGAWLEEMGLPEYLDTFVQNGFEDHESISTLTDEDLKDSLKVIKLGHRRKILIWIARLKQESNIARPPAEEEIGEPGVAPNYYGEVPSNNNIESESNLLPHFPGDNAEHKANGAEMRPIRDLQRYSAEPKERSSNFFNPFFKTTKENTSFSPGKNILQKPEIVRQEFQPATLDITLSYDSESRYLFVGKGVDSNGNQYNAKGFSSDAVKVAIEKPFQHNEIIRERAYYKQNPSTSIVQQNIPNEKVLERLPEERQIAAARQGVDIDAAISGGISALSSSLVTNAIAYSQGEKTGTQAAKQVATDTAIGTLAGSAVGVVGGTAISCVFFGLETCEALWKWWRGDISALECSLSVARSFTVKAAGTASAAAIGWALSFVTPIGPLLWVLPIVGAALAYSGGASAADYLFKQAAQRIFPWINKSKPDVLKDAYAFLGVNSDDPNSVINRAYRVMALRYHPDRGGNGEDWVKLGLYIEIIRAHRAGKQYFEERVLLLGYS